MLEIFVVYSLCQKTVANAKAREKKTGIAIMYTILLWLGFEIYGSIIAALVLSALGVLEQYKIVSYIVALAMAALGGYIAVLISKVAKPIHDVVEPPNAFTMNKNQKSAWKRDLSKHEDDLCNKNY